MAKVKGTRIVRMYKNKEGKRFVYMMIRTRHGTYSAEMEHSDKFNVGLALQQYLEEVAFQQLDQRNHGLITQSDLDLAGVVLKER